MNATCTASLLTRWRRSFGARRRRYSPARPLAGLGYLANGPALEGLIELENLVLAVLYDEPEAHGRTATWLAGFGGVLGPWGVRWGGPQENRFLKDFSLRPAPGARGRRPDLGREALLKLALDLDAKIERYVRCPQVAGATGSGCPSSGPGSAGRAQPRSQATARNWPTPAGAWASQPSSSWKNRGGPTRA